MRNIMGQHVFRWRDFFNKWQIRQIITGKIRKGNVLHHINSSQPLEKFQIYLAQLASIFTIKEIKYLFTMVYNFSKYGSTKWIADKTTQTTIKALKSWLATHNKPDIIQSDNGKEFKSREFKQFLTKLNILQIFGMPYNEKSQGAIEILIKIIQKFSNQLNISALILFLEVLQGISPWAFRKTSRYFKNGVSMSKFSFGEIYILPFFISSLQKIIYSWRRRFGNNS